MEHLVKFIAMLLFEVSVIRMQGRRTFFFNQSDT